MGTRIRKQFSIKFVFVCLLILFSLPTLVHAVDIIMGNGEFIGLGIMDGRIMFIDAAPDEIIIRDAELGINVPSPNEMLHIGDGNVLIESDGETAIKFKRSITYTGGPSGESINPIFELGRIIQAGDGDPEFRVLYSDATATPQAVFEFDRKGIVASVKADRGSHFEGFVSPTDPEPIFRLNSYPDMRLEMGAGGTERVDVAIQRETTKTLTILTDEVERVRINESGMEVSDGYLKLDTSLGIPPQDDCDNQSEVGRMKMDSEKAVLYLCTAFGWRKGFLSISEMFIPSVQSP